MLIKTKINNNTDLVPVFVKFGWIPTDLSRSCMLVFIILALKCKNAIKAYKRGKIVMYSHIELWLQFNRWDHFNDKIFTSHDFYFKNLPLFFGKAKKFLPFKLKWFNPDPPGKSMSLEFLVLKLHFQFCMVVKKIFS